MESSGITEPQEGEKVAVLLRIPSSLKKRWMAYARAHGLTLNGAAITLMERALDEAEKQP